MKPPPDPLDSILESYRLTTPSQPDSVQREVWRRIAHAETTASATPAWWHRLDGLFSNSGFAAVFVAACLLLGLFLAEVRLTHVQRERTAALERGYLQMIDPLLAAKDLPRAQAKPAVHRP